MSFTETMDHVAQAFEILGVLVLVSGIFWSTWLAVVAWRGSHQGWKTYQAGRASFGRVLLMGLEILVAADLIRTVAVDPTLESVSVLGLIVVIRTVLSFSLEVEIDGVAPWRRNAAPPRETRP
jgi:uncharacterized membrane protein